MKISQILEATRNILIYELTAQSRTKLLQIFPPKYPDVICHHITAAFGVNSNVPLPKNAVINLVGYTCDSSLEALVVSVDGATKRPDGKTYHITLSLNKSQGRKPKDSNELVSLGWQLVQPLQINAVPARL